MLEFISPMLAKAVDKSKAAQAISDENYSIEAKHDGMRAIIVKNGNDVEIYSRTGKPYATHLPKLVEVVREHSADSFILDGELSHISGWANIRGAQIPVVDFNATMRVMGSGSEKAIAKQEETPITFIAFDLLNINGTSLLDTPFNDRSDVMFNNFLDLNAHMAIGGITLNDVWDMRWDKGILQEFMDAGIEGAIYKHKESLYLPGKRASSAWYKAKIEKTADVVVMGFHEAKEGKFFGQIGAIKFGAFDDQGELQYLGKCSGMDDAERLRWTHIRDTETEAEWNNRVIEVRYNDLVGSGEFKSPRHPQFLIERIDKNPADCTMEQFKA